MVTPLVSIPELQTVPYQKMTADLANLNLALLSGYVSSIHLKTGRKGKLKLDQGWFRRSFDISAVERTYEIALKLHKDPEVSKKISGFNANFDASLKGLQNLIVYYESRNRDSHARLKALQTKVLNTLTEEVVPVSTIPTPPPIPTFVTDPVRKIRIRRGHQSVCLDKENLKVEFMTELFATIKLKAPVIEETSVLKNSALANDNEWDFDSTPVTASVIARKELQRTVSFYDQRTPQFCRKKEYEPVNKQALEDMTSSLILAVSKRRNSMRGKGFFD